MTTYDIMQRPLRRRALLGAALAAPAALALRPAHALAAPGDWSADIALLRDAYETLHPGLYRYASPRTMAARFDALAAEWARAPSLRSAFLALSRMTASIQCGHSYVNFYNQSDAIKDALFRDVPRLPFLFRWVNGRMVVTASQGLEAPIARGTIIHRINGTRAAAMLAALLPLARADGGNDGKRRDLLSCQGNEEWETFDLFFGNMWPDARTFTLDVILPDGRRDRLERASITLAARQVAWVSTRDAMKNDRPVWTFVIDAGGIATLTMPGWALYNSKWDWQGFLNDCFAEMAAKGTRALIIDLRGNEGGLDCGDAVIARLIDAPLMPESYARRVRFERVPERLLKHMRTWDKSFSTLGVDAVPLAGGFRALPAGAVERIEPMGPSFRGKVAVIVDAGNSSATWRFASIIKSAGLGTIVGETTGGNMRGINGGAFYFMKLPLSGLEVDVPLIGAFPTRPMPDGGVDPDVRVTATVKDIAAGFDRKMAAARRIVMA